MWRTLPGFHLPGTRYGTRLSRATCEERIRTRVAADDGRFAGSVSKKELLRQSTPSGISLRVRDSWRWRYFLYDLRFRSAAQDGTEVELRPYIRRGVAIGLASWLVFTTVLFLAGLQSGRRIPALAGAFNLLATVALLGAVELLSRRRARADARFVEALVMRDLEAQTTGTR
jgi:hypothetical protein